MKLHLKEVMSQFYADGVPGDKSRYTHCAFDTNCKFVK